MNGYNSKNLNVTCGVPQGSVLGPLLFLIYINYIPNSSSKFAFYLFADDTSIYFESGNLEQLQKVVNSELEHVKKWLDANKLALNVDKTNFVIFHSPQKPLYENITIKFGKQHVTKAKHVKFLGLLLDENLSWKHHLSELSKKLARTCGIFFKARHLPTNVLVSLYYSLFASSLQYGIVVWGLTYDTYIKPIFILKKKVERAITFNNFSAPSAPIFLTLRLLKLQDLFEMKLLTFVYEAFNKFSPSCFHEFFDVLSQVHQHDTRQARKGDILFTRKNMLQYGLKSIRYAGAKSWNSISHVIKQAPTVMSFRHQLKLHFFATNYKSWNFKQPTNTSSLI